MKTLKKNNISQGSSINSPVPVNKDCELPPFFNEDYFGHVVVQTIEELNSIPCKLRQEGMVATVVQDSYAEWQLQSSRIGFSKCDNRSWVKINSGDTFYDGSNLFIFPTQAEADIYKSTPAVKEGQVIYIIETNTYFKYDGQDAYVDPFPNKLTVPTEDGVEGPDYKVPAYLADGVPYWRSTKDFGKVKSVNNKIGDVILKTSDLENDSDYTTNNKLNKEIQDRISADNLKLDKPTTNNTPDYVLLADGSTAPKSDFGKVDTVMGVQAGANKNVDISSVAMNWTNASQRWSALPNKSGENTYNKVMVLDADGKAGTKDASDLGKNFANTDLVVTTNRKHTGTASVEFGMPFICSNASVRYSGLLDKSADATYNQLLGVDSNGYVAKVGLSAVTNAMSKSTDAQKDAFRLASRKSTEGYSVGVPRVDYILPNIISNNKDEITYVSVVGLNLLLNLQDCEVKLINTVTNQEYLVSVIQTLAQSSSMFSFGFNFFNKPVGDYRIFVRNGIQTNIDTTVFTLVESISTEPLAVNFNRYFKEGLSEAYKNTFTTGVNYISKNRDTTSLRNTPIADFVSQTPIVIDAQKDFVFTCLFTINTSAGGYLGDAQLGLTQGFVENIYNTVQYGVKFGYINLISSLTSKNLVTGLLNSSKQIQIQIIKRGPILNIVTSVDGVYSSDVASVNIVNPLYFIFKNSSATDSLDYVTPNPIVINLLSLQYLN